MMSYLKVFCIFTRIFSSFGYDDLSRNKPATQISTFPCKGCQDGSYDAEMAVDNNLQTCTRNENPDETEWWMVDLQETQSIYAIKFVFKDTSDGKRQQERLSGYAIYVSKSAEIKSGELCFKHNGTYIPSLTAEHICPSFGRYVQFVNNFKYTELCDFIVLGCQIGHYGANCNLPCPPHCKNKQCFVTNGTCISCADGWTGSKCNQVCAAEMYGPDCLLYCSSHCKYNSTCNSTHGFCSDGCMEGWMGVFCSTSCVSGTFGQDCRYNCSGNCFNDSYCNSITGKCDKGCKLGYQGELCTNVCTTEKYGTGCMFPCSKNCINKESCDHVTGGCKNGCSDGYKGEKCNLICGNGYFGANCSNVCSENCSDICHHIDGRCNCKAGMMDSLECIQVSLLTTARKCDDHCLYAIGISILVILNVLTCTLWIRERKKQVKLKRQSSSHYITSEAEMKEKTCESHEYQEVNSVSRDFSYQNLTFDT